MIPPESSHLADIVFIPTNEEELFLALVRMMAGSRLPSNVIDYVNPYKHKPACLPEGIWYFIDSKENTDTEFGFWKTRGEASEVFSNSAIIGWGATLQYYDGQVPHECKTDWLMEVFSITQKKLCDNSMMKETSVLCRVFLGGEQSTDQNMQQKMRITYTTTSEQNNSTGQLLPKGDNDTSVGCVASTSKSKVKRDDEAGELVVTVTERLTDNRGESPPEADYISREDYLELLDLTDNRVENSPEADYISGEDYLELLDLDNPESPSSSDSSSCITMSSGERFDSETDQALEQRNASYLFKVSASQKTTDMVTLPAISGSVHVRRNPSTTKIPKTNSRVPISATESRDPDNKAAKHPIRNQKRDRQGKGSSSGSYNSSTPYGNHTATTDGQKKGAMGRIKRLKKYFCFNPF